MILSSRGAKLTDFGLARLGDSTLTAAGSVLRHARVQRAGGARARAEFGPASDQFSLAATLFELLCARRAFPGDDALTIATRIATEPAPPLPFASADPRLVSRLDAVLARALSKDPAQRYPSCRTFGEALAAATEARTCPRRPSPRRPLPARSSRAPRAPRAQPLIAAVALLVIIGLVVLGRPPSEEGSRSATSPTTSPPPRPRSTRIARGARQRRGIQRPPGGRRPARALPGSSGESRGGRRPDGTGSSATRMSLPNLPGIFETRAGRRYRHRGPARRYALRLKRRPRMSACYLHADGG